VESFEDTFDGTTSLTNCTKRSIYDSWNSQQSGVMDPDYASWASLDCPRCDANEYVSNNTCVACAANMTNDAGDDASGSDTTCDWATLCASNQYVSNNACVACPSGQSNLAGDDPSGPDTSCDTCTITTNQELRDYVDQWMTNPTNHPCGPVIGDWEVGRVTDLSYVFCAKNWNNCNTSRSDFTANISNWDTSKVTAMRFTFVGLTWYVVFSRSLYSLTLKNIKSPTLKNTGSREIPCQIGIRRG